MLNLFPYDTIFLFEMLEQDNHQLMRIPEGQPLCLITERLTGTDS